MCDLDEIKYKNFGEIVKLIIFDLKLMVVLYCYIVLNDNVFVLKVE